MPVPFFFSLADFQDPNTDRKVGQTNNKDKQTTKTTETKSDAALRQHWIVFPAIIALFRAYPH